MIGDKSHLFFQSLLVIGHCGSVTHKQQSVPWGVSLPPSDELDNGKTELVNKDEHVAKNKKRGDLPGSPVPEAQHFHCGGPGFGPRTGNQIPRAATKSSHATSKIWCSQNKYINARSK